MRRRIDLVDGSSTALETVQRVRALIGDGARAMVVLDSNHSLDHVLAELRAYGLLVPVGGYLVAADGIMRDMAEAPRGRPEWVHDNPLEAARRFVAEDPRFALVEPDWAFNEGLVRERVTYWPSCYVRRVA
jgi:cephalosporin hydroxylase